ncbi:hypothetical protein THAR02_04793 [Trichoderma harzianum]|uniref:Uncharacterized protein n=1 Tax=Trichoderma harzianum TaxID=5544 RepID=A0A0F9XF28_TRIHA|nr:hypothetical protein THAR02_04793 [Trichoderma harzianum]
MPSASSSTSTSTSTSISSSQSRPISSTNSSSSYSNSKSKWDTEYLAIPREKGLPLRFIAYAAGASLPITMKKMTRKEKRRGQSTSIWDFFGRNTQLLWIAQPEDRWERGRSRTPRGRDGQKSTSTASFPDVSFFQEAYRDSTGHVPPPAASCAACGPGVAPAHGYS